ncbi:hypothetical protein M9Y10_012686 [Tritrichomonas musculus]|uniref:Uncharacterized protein n=1 Tax=Tritrichomonas musculus TaxID=1915356 RepID=A0ABR2ID43_9EUKA
MAQQAVPPSLISYSPTPEPKGYQSSFILAFVVAIVIGVVGLIISIIATFTCVRPVADSLKNNRKEINLEDFESSDDY